jgi:hypothetical protein
VQRRDVDAPLARDPPCERRRLHAAPIRLPTRAGDLGARGLLGLRSDRPPSLALLVTCRCARAFFHLLVGDLRSFGLLRGGRPLVPLPAVIDFLAGLADERDRPPHVDLALAHCDLQEDARRLRLHLLRHLLRIELVQRLAALHLVTLVLEPADDRARFHPLAQPRQLDLGGHQCAVQ